MTKKRKRPKKRVPLLRQIRESKKLSRVVVDRASAYIAEKMGNKDYHITGSRLWQFEHQEGENISGAKLAVLSLLYGVTVDGLLPHFFPSLYQPAVADAAREELAKLQAAQTK